MSSTTLDPAPPRRRWTRLIGLPVAAVGLAGLVACGTGAASTTTSSSTGSGAQAGTSDTAMQAFASCLAENGVTLPQRGSGGDADGGSPPTGTPPTGTPPTGAPTAGGAGGPGQGGGAMAAPAGVDATTWAAAQKACAQYAPTPPSGTAAAG
jgi:hypothetical protein